MNGRRWRRNLLLAPLIGSALWVCYVISGVERSVEGLSLATAYVGLGLLVITLSIGPLNVMRRRPNPVSTHLRRDLGVWAAIAGIAHTLLGLEVHLGGRFTAYFTLPAESASPKSMTFFVAANYMGALATVLLIMLLFLSNDVALRRLGIGTWKALQRWSYAVLALVALHGIVYQILEKRQMGAVLIAALLVAAVTAVQLRGAAIRRRGSTGR